MFYDILNRILQITGGLTDILAIVPVIPVFVAAVSVIHVVIEIITNATKLEKYFLKLMLFIMQKIMLNCLRCILKDIN